MRLPLHEQIGFLFLLGWSSLVVPAHARQEPRTGEQVYAAMCLRCHGANGEGTDDYPDPLVGDLSLAQLSRRIERTMPDDAPGTCSADDAARVAAFIHASFYSPVARERNRPARIELSRLTIRQYQNVVADLIGGLREGGDGVWISPDRGLTGRYAAARRRRSEGTGKAIERVDPNVAFDFGIQSPIPTVVDPRRLSIRRQGAIFTGSIDPAFLKSVGISQRSFSIRWTGSVIAPETGDYEFIVKADHSARLFVNDVETPLVDASVISGADDEYRGSIRLLGGRAYPLRLEFNKEPRGVQGKDEDKLPPAPSRVALDWVPPFGVREPLPNRRLTPQNRPPVFVLETPFPPDDRSVGYERGSGVSKAWDEATTNAAIEIATYVADHHKELVGAEPGDEGYSEKARAFGYRFVERAFRRPLSDIEKSLYVDRAFDGGIEASDALRRVMLLGLKSPRFLYPILGPPSDPNATATRLALFLWDSLPDDELRKAAAEERLATRDQLAEQARRMLDDPRCRSKLRAFLMQWLKVDQVAEVAKSPESFADFDHETVSDLRTSLDLFLDHLIWSDSEAGGDFRRLFLEDAMPLNARLGRLYGAEVDPGSDFALARPVAGERAGLLTHPYLLSVFAYTGTTSPIHRGVFLARNVMGVGLKPPPDAFSPLAPDLHPDLTTRERVDLQTRPAACISCHGTINPLGFALEAYDAIGRWRSEEQGKAIDDTGAFETRDGRRVTFDGARDLGAFVADSPEAHEAFIEQLFHYLVKQPIRAYGVDTLDRLRQEFAAHSFNVRDLIVTIAAEASDPLPKVPGSVFATASSPTPPQGSD